MNEDKDDTLVWLGFSPQTVARIKDALKAIAVLAIHTESSPDSPVKVSSKHTDAVVFLARAFEKADRAVKDNATGIQNLHP